MISMSNLYNKFGIHINTEPLLVFKKSDCHLDERMQAIKAFTSNFTVLQELYLNKGFIYSYNNKRNQIKYQEEIIEFYKFSDWLSRDLPNVTEIKEELLDYEKRTGKCHLMSMHFLKFYGNFLVTGYVDSKNERIIHTWIEDGDYVIDYTFNLVINKKIYYKLMNVQVLSEIDKDTFIRDISSSFIRSFISIKFYLLFREELKKSGLFEFDNSEQNKHL